MRYELYSWPSNQGRGEFVRLALEEAATDYIDVGRLPDADGYGVPAILKLINATDLKTPSMRKVCFGTIRSSTTERADWAALTRADFC
jgi:hypothetical protein